MPIKKTILLGERLIEKNLISAKELEIGLEEHRKTGQFIGITLVAGVELN